MMRMSMLMMIPRMVAVMNPPFTGLEKEMGCLSIKNIQMRGSSTIQILLSA